MSCAITEWGPAGWKLLHCVAATYPSSPTQQDREQMMNFLKLFAWALPCKVCGKHFASLLQDENAYDSRNPMYDNSKTLFSWVNSAHNNVNRRLNKKEVSLQEAEQSLYTQKQKPSKTDKSKHKIRLLSVLITVLLAAVALYYVSQH